MFNSYNDYFKKAPVIYWAIIVGLVAIAFGASWSCSAWKSEAEIKQSRLKETMVWLEQANAEIDKANATIQERNVELQSAHAEIDKGNLIIQQQYSEINRLSREVDKANRAIQQQNVALKCYARKSNDTDLLSILGNLILPVFGGAIASAFGQQQDC